jgi:hypothetical protein
MSCVLSLFIVYKLILSWRNLAYVYVLQSRRASMLVYVEDELRTSTGTQTILYELAADLLHGDSKNLSKLSRGTADKQVGGKMP